MRTARDRGIDWMRLLSVVAVIGLLAVGLAGCGYANDSGGMDEIGVAPMVDSYTEESADMEMLASEAPGEPQRGFGDGDDASSIAAQDRLIIRNKSLRIEVEDVKATVDEIRDRADEHGALVTNANISTDQGPVYRYDEYGVGSGAALSGWITLRVPTAEYDAFLDSIEDLGEIIWEGESSDDVTQQHVDLSARLENLKAEEVRLREFFEAAQDVDDMLSIEYELNRIRQEVESLTAQIAYFERQAAMATVTIELSEPAAVVRPDGPDWGFADAITGGLQLAANVVNALIVVFLGSLPLLLIGAVLFVIARMIWKARMRKGRADAAQTTPTPTGGRTDG